MFDRQALTSEGLGVHKGLTRALVDTKQQVWRRQVQAARLAEIGSAAAAVLSVNPTLQEDFLEGSLSILSDALQQAVRREHFNEFTLPSELRTQDEPSSAPEATAQRSTSISRGVPSKKHLEGSEEVFSSSESPSGRTFTAFEKDRKFLGFSVVNTARALGMRPTHESNAHGLCMHGNLAFRKLYILEPSDVVDARERMHRDEAAYPTPSASVEADIHSPVSSQRRSSYGPMHGAHALHATDLGAAPHNDLDPNTASLCETLKDLSLIHI